MGYVIGNAFSVNMIDKPKTLLLIENVTEDVVKAVLTGERFVSIIGHEATAAFLTKKLGIPIPHARIEYKLKPDHILIVGSLGKRLPEGMVLTEQELSQFPIQWYVITEVSQGRREA